MVFPRKAGTYAFHLLTFVCELFIATKSAIISISKEQFLYTALNCCTMIAFQFSSEERSFLESQFITKEVRVAVEGCEVAWKALKKARGSSQKNDLASWNFEEKVVKNCT